MQENKTYNWISKKRTTRKQFFSGKSGKIITLLGNSFRTAVKTLKKFEITSYEINPIIYMRQKESKFKRINFKFGDILSAPVEEGVFYDLDFCCTIFSVEEHVRKFKDTDFLLTICLRGKTLESSLAFFSKIMGSDTYKIRRYRTQRNLYILSAGEKTYRVITYRDGAPMCCIAKL